MKPNGKPTVLAAVGIEEWRSLTDAAISRRVGVAAPNVSAYRRRQGLPKSPHRGDVSSLLATVEIEEWRTLSNPEIARRNGVSDVTAWAYRKIQQPADVSVYLRPWPAFESAGPYSLEAALETAQMKGGL